MSLTLLTTTPNINNDKIIEQLNKYNWIITDDQTYPEIYKTFAAIIVVSSNNELHNQHNSLRRNLVVVGTLAETDPYVDGDIAIFAGQALCTAVVERYKAVIYDRDKLDAIVVLRNKDDIVTSPSFLPTELLEYKAVHTWSTFGNVLVETIKLNNEHQEQQYLDLLREILYYGQRNVDRTGVGTLSLFGKSMTFDLRKGFPLLTTKFVPFEMIKKELLFFISGKTDTKILEAQNVGIWKGNTSAEELAKKNLPWREGDMGPGYSFQWRHAGAIYTGCDTDYIGQGVDQIKNLIEGLKNKPHDRRHIISAWNVKDISQMALPPCHCFAQFYVDGSYLDCLLYQRSADMFLGVPFNIASYALLTTIIGQLTSLTPRKLIHELGDCHIYLNHIQQVQQQLTRNPHPFPTLAVTTPITDIDNIALESLKVINYKHHDKITAVMAV